MFHSNKFGAKDRGPNGQLFLQNPVDEGHVTEDEDPRVGTMGPFVPCMVTIAHHAMVNVSPKWHWHVRWNCLYNVAVIFRPVIAGKGRRVNVGVSWVKDES